MSAEVIGLACDVGGTNCRFALARKGAPALMSPVTYPCTKFVDFAAAVEFYLNTEAKGARIDWAVVAVAGPVDRDVVAMTNRTWRISAAEIASRFAIPRVQLVNDFSALAAALPHLGGDDRVAIGGGAPRAVGAVTTSAVIGPGTGLGVGGLVVSARGATVLATEGGHAAFAATNALEREIVHVLSARFDRVSNERLLCGEGLANIHLALCAIDGAAALDLAPEEITRRARAKSDARCVRALDVFSGALGAFSGDIVLTLGAWGGLAIAGGMMPVILDVFDRAAFRARFEAKGRFSKLLEATPAWIILHAYPALVGAAALADAGDETAPAAKRSKKISRG